jgi:hypothetical protein
MTFKTSSGEKATMSITGLKSDITGAEVSKVMDVIIAKNVCYGKGGDFIGKVGAEIVSRNVADLKV